MNFYQYLIDTYGYNEPILWSEISFENYSQPWLQKECSKLCEENKLVRFEKGIYYIPTQTLLGNSKLDPQKVITKKYIDNGRDIIGYYSGIAFMNQLGLTTQMPNLIEIYTNTETSRTREIPVGSQAVLLRRSRTPINKNNVDVMSFLELMNSTESSFYTAEKQQLIKNYIQKKNICRKDISRYTPFFPDKAMRTLVESEIIYHVAP